MKTLLSIALAASVAFVAVAPAGASGGCGRGYHRGPRGGCRINGGPGFVVGPNRLIIGNFYRGRGYWDGRRYYQNRFRYHNGWRYR